MLRETTTSYAGRQVDVELLKHVGEMLRTQRVQRNVVGEFEKDKTTLKDEFKIAPRIVSGIEKAVQRYAKTFLTNLGSVKVANWIGNDLLASIKRGEIPNETYLAHLFAVADGNTLEVLSDEDEDTETYGAIPDDERIVDTELVDMELDYSTGTVKIHVFITTAAGDSFKFIIPVGSGLR